jgi:Tol biopolymer transport system component
VHRRAAVVILAAVVVAAPAGSAPGHTPTGNGWIAFSSSREGEGRLRLYKLEPVGGAVTPLAELRGRQPAWSPDGSQIAFVDERYRLAVASSDGTSVSTLTSGRFPIREPAWSPDGSRIAFTRFTQSHIAGDIFVIAANGSGLRRLTNTLEDNSEPAWSPNGSRIAFASNRDPRRRIGDLEIYLIRPDGSGLRRLTANDVDDSSPSWSPAGAEIAFVSGRAHPGNASELWLMRSDGRGQRRIQPASGPGGFPSWEDRDPSWSPDGEWLVYVSSDRTNYPENIFIVRPDGRGKTDLTPATQSYDVDPAWQPVCSVAGTEGRDRLGPAPTDDRLCGYSRADVLRGGAGRDGLYGGDGADKLLARDGSFDVVGCGSGRDDVVADRVDLVGVDCERVLRR